jgi:hypothetical protein
LIIDKCNQSELNSREFKELLVVIKMLIPSDLQAGISKLDILYILGAKYNVHPNKVLELIQGSNIEYAIQTLTSDGVSNID